MSRYCNPDFHAIGDHADGHKVLSGVQSLTWPFYRTLCSVSQDYVVRFRNQAYLENLLEDYKRAEQEKYEVKSAWMSSSRGTGWGSGMHRAS